MRARSAIKYYWIASQTSGLVLVVALARLPGQHRGLGRARPHAVDDDAGAHDEHEPRKHQEGPPERAQRVEQLVGRALEVLAARDRVEGQHERPDARVALELQADGGVAGEHALVRVVAANQEHPLVLLQSRHLFHVFCMHMT